jgi:hypothetical protein
MRYQSSSKIHKGLYPLLMVGILFLILGSSILFAPENVYATQITLAWDQSDGATGYKIYSGVTTNSYSWVVDVGNVTNYTTANLTDGYTYYFAATAYDASGLESDYSAEVSYAANAVPCSYSISPLSASFGAVGGTGTIAVTTQNGCAWTAASGVNWVTITSGTNGTGSGTVSYSVTSNGSASRSAVSTIAGQLFTFSQSGTQSFTISASAGTGGTISPSGSVSVNYGASQTFMITANSGYTISGVTVDGASAGAVSSYTFSNVTAGHTIAATFTAIPATYTLSTSRTGTGTGLITASPSGTTFTAGTVVTLTAAANTNSTFTGWSGACSGTATTCQVTMNGNTSVGAAFTLKSFTISASAGTGGTISPSGSVSVNYGASQTFTITANSGYTISGVTVDGASAGAISSYTFSNVTTGHTITATFTAIPATYTLSTSRTGTGTGSITTSPSGTTFAAGTVVTLTAAANINSTLTGWSGACSGTATTCQVTMNGNTSVGAAFTLKSFTISASAGTGGAISPSGSVSVNYGASQTFTITANSRYRIRRVTIDGISVGAVSSYTFTNVNRTHTIKVTFGR